MKLNKYLDDFAQAKAILRDAIIKQSMDVKDKESVGIQKIIQAREENIDFELGLAERICGNNPNFPYRSSFYITKFFSDLGLPFTHDGSTRHNWIKDVLLQLDSSQISQLIKNGLFRKIDYKNEKYRTDRNRGISSNDFLRFALDDFKKFIDDSLRANETIDIAEILNLNVNIDLILQTKSETSDSELNKIIEEAKDRYFKPNDQNIALEKIWDAFERMKTYYDSDKKKSVAKLIKDMSKNIDETEIKNEFEELTRIGNTYRIRHHEIDKKEINDPSQIKYLFFRMLSLIDLGINSIER